MLWRPVTPNSCTPCGFDLMLWLILDSASCSQATAAKFLEADSRQQHQEGQAQLQQQLFSIISDYGACSNCQAEAGSKEDDAVSFVDLPIYNLLFDGKQIQQLDYTDYQQGIGCLCIE